MMVSGYEAPLVIEYLDSLGIRRANGEFAWLNEKRVTESNRATIRRWESLDIVPLARLDAVLMRYDLMTFEFEYWAEQHHGRNGFIDPRAEPKELAI